ncbi:hypothetical protein [Hymenobacter sp. BRD67]|uniref:hypothetical protein n=1 Tax=Hymenobacter sp. BRD67 TaxID=2675877 RepID=UPI0015643C7C|nr:hypothetical protein [Hymenobacter sp. BRD67]QKG52568.1 hypothetical protein GKZ67_08100 [Hymenobacter sp. BRD67]
MPVSPVPAITSAPTPAILPPATAGPVAETAAEAAAPLPASAAEPPAPTVQSPDGRLVLTATSLTVLGQAFGLRELERAEVQPVRWLLWYLLGGLGLTIILLLFLNNWLHTLPTMAGLLATALMLLYGHRGTNRLRLWLLGREVAHFALPGDLATWQRLVGELNRRVSRAHDQAAAETAALLAALEAERTAAEAPEPATDAHFLDPPIPNAPA